MVSACASCLWTPSPSPSSRSGATDPSWPPSSLPESTMWFVDSKRKIKTSSKSPSWGGSHPGRVSWSRNLHRRCRLGGSAHCKVFFWRKQLVGTTLYNMLYYMYDCIIKPQVHLDQEDHLPWRSRLPWLCHRLHLHRPQRRRHWWDSWHSGLI